MNPNNAMLYVFMGVFAYIAVFFTSVGIFHDYELEAYRTYFEIGLLVAALPIGLCAWIVSRLNMRYAVASTVGAAATTAFTFVSLQLMYRL